MSVGPFFDQRLLGENRCLLGKCSTALVAHMRDSIQPRFHHEGLGGIRCSGKKVAFAVRETDFDLRALSLP